MGHFLTQASCPVLTCSDLVGCRSEAQQAAKTMISLEKEREKYSSEASDATAKYLQASHLPGCG
jgi:hypothetical protein